MNVKILNVFHTHFDCRVDHPYYLPIQSGKALSHEDLDMQGDNEGENISERADMGEYRCVYWAWKNLPKDVDIVGLSHYRRFFDFNGLGNSYQELIWHPVDRFDQLNFDIPEWIINFVKEGGIIVTKRKYFETSAMFQMCFGHNSEYLQVFRDTLNGIGQIEFCNYFFKHIKEVNYIHPCCMFLMNRKNFDEYCSWLFPIFETFANNIKEKGLTKAISDRSSVFIIERVWSCYIYYKKFRIKELSFIQLSKKSSESDYYDSSLLLKLKALIYRYQMKFSWLIYRAIKPGETSGYGLDINIL